MSMWLKKELERIASTDDLHISPLREDGKTYGTPTWIWSVVVDGTLYVRAYNGKESRWYKAALRQKAGPASRDREVVARQIRTAEEKLGRSVTEEHSVSVAMEEVKPEEWAEKVYRPEITNSLDKLYKKPGYDESNR